MEKVLEVLSVDHPRFREFFDLLCGPDGCNFIENADPSKTTWTCHHDHRLSRAILEKMGSLAVEASLAKITAGCCCDCEITFNRTPHE
jgi:hypothetical protein